MRRHATISAARRALAWMPFLLVAISTPANHASATGPPAQASPSPPAHQATTPPPAPAAPDTLVGTVHAVDAKARTLDVITGVGHAFRLVPLHVAPDCRIRDSGAATQLAKVEPGWIVRVQYLRAAPLRGRIARVAVSIDRLPVPGSGGAR